MKITKTTLRRIIKEELQRVLREDMDDDPRNFGPIDMDRDPEFRYRGSSAEQMGKLLKSYAQIENELLKCMKIAKVMMIGRATWQKFLASLVSSIRLQIESQECVMEKAALMKL